MVNPRILSILGGIFALSACTADNGRYPSLATRDIELRENLFNVPPAPPATQAPAPSAELTARLAQLDMQIGNAHKQFLAILPEVQSAVTNATGSQKGSPARAEAMVRISELDAARSQGVAALAELDGLRVSAAIAGAARGAIETAWAKADAIVLEESATLQALTGQIAQ